MAQNDLYRLPRMSFEEWSAYVEARWSAVLRKELGPDVTRAAMKVHRALLTSCSGVAYAEYVKAWQRRN